MSKILTGGVGLNAEYVTAPDTPVATLIAGFVEQANTIVDAPNVAVSEEQAVVSFWVSAVMLKECENSTTAAVTPIATTMTTNPIAILSPRVRDLPTIGRRPGTALRMLSSLVHSSSTLVSAS